MHQMGVFIQGNFSGWAIMQCLVWKTGLGFEDVHVQGGTVGQIFVRYLSNFRSVNA